MRSDPGEETAHLVFFVNLFRGVGRVHKRSVGGVKTPEETCCHLRTVPYNPPEEWTVCYAVRFRTDCNMQSYYQSETFVTSEHRSVPYKIRTSSSGRGCRKICKI